MSGSGGSTADSATTIGSGTREVVGAGNLQGGNSRVHVGGVWIIRDTSNESHFVELSETLDQLIAWFDEPQSNMHPELRAKVLAMLDVLRRLVERHHMVPESICVQSAQLMEQIITQSLKEGMVDALRPLVGKFCTGVLLVFGGYLGGDDAVSAIQSLARIAGESPED